MSAFECVALAVRAEEGAFDIIGKRPPPPDPCDLVDFANDFLDRFETVLRRSQSPRLAENMRPLPHVLFPERFDCLFRVA